MSQTNRPILLIEEDPVDVDLTRRAFARQKLLNPLLVTRDGEQVLDLIDNWDAGDPLPAVVLLDLKFPVLDALEILRLLKSHPEFMMVPVIVLTSSEQDCDIQAAYQRGANSYIVKPVDFEKFVEVAAQIDLYWNVINMPPR